MLKKGFIYFLIFAFINYILGCSISVSDKINIPNVPPSEQITSIVLKSGKSISFKKNGAKFITTDQVLSGQIMTKPTVIPIDEIESIRIKLFPLRPNDDVKSNKVSEILTNDDKLLIFNESGARLTENKYWYEGVTIDGNELSVGISDVKRIYGAKAETITKEGLLANPSQKVKQVILKNGDVKTFDLDGADLTKQKTGIGGTNDNDLFVVVNPDSVLYVTVEKVDLKLSILASFGVVLAIVGGIVLVILATKQSCPFIYSFDGSNYVFDAEPLGGATTKGLERYEVSRLEKLKEVDGKYKLLVRNEVEESQYINSMKLLVVDHPVNSQIVYTFEGVPYIVDETVPLSSAYDENKNSLYNFLAKEDHLTWMTSMPSDSSNITTDKRHHLTFTFPKPKQADKINFVYNIGTSLWGSKMIREMLSLYGDNLNNWYDAIDKKGVDHKQLMDFTQREETYQLKIYAKDKSDWRYLGLINGGGPLIIENRISTFDISGLVGDSITLKVDPPKGFWMFNYVAANYSNLKSPNVTELTAQKATDMNGKDISEFLNNSDGLYYQMPAVGDYYNLEFKAPKMQQNLKRSLFIGSDGYYKLIFKDPIKTELMKLMSIVSTPGKIVDYAMEKYIEWKINNNKTLVRTTD